VDSLRSLAKLISSIRGDADALAELILDVDDVAPDTRLLYGLIRAAANDGHTLDTLGVLTGIPRDKLAAVITG
jgi:3-deoxy-D-manno-octulosonate 8-phosphate phosphatase KdsC-like HAD superfamily phosphatase